MLKLGYSLNIKTNIDELNKLVKIDIPNLLHAVELANYARNAVSQLQKTREFFSESNVPLGTSEQTTQVLNELDDTIDTLEGISRSVHEIDSIMENENITSEDRLSLFKLSQAENFSLLLNADKAFQDQIENVKGYVDMMIIEQNKLISEKNSRRESKYIASVIGVIRSVDDCVDDHDDDKEKLGLAKAMLNIEKTRLPQPVYGLFQATYSKVANEEDNNLELAKYTVTVLQQGKSVGAANSIIKNICHD